MNSLFIINIIFIECFVLSLRFIIIKIIQNLFTKNTSIEIIQVQEEHPEKEYSSGSTLLRRGKKLEDNNNLTKEDLEYINYRQLLKYEQAPAYLQHNPFIRDGYRKMLPTKLCWER